MRLKKKTNENVQQDHETGERNDENSNERRVSALLQKARKEASRIRREKKRWRLKNGGFGLGRQNGWGKLEERKIPFQIEPRGQRDSYKFAWFALHCTSTEGAVANAMRGFPGHVEEWGNVRFSYRTLKRQQRVLAEAEPRPFLQASSPGNHGTL